MGVEYLVLDKKNERIFWLGKGPWWHLMAEDEHGYPIHGTFDGAAKDPVTLAQLLENAWGGASFSNFGPPGHLTAVARKLSRFCTEANGQVELRSDSGDYPYDWPEICTAYSDPIFEEDLKPDPLGGTGWRWNDPPKESP